MILSQFLEVEMGFILEIISSIIEFIIHLFLSIPWWVYAVVLFVVLLINCGWTVWWLK